MKRLITLAMSVFLIFCLVLPFTVPVLAASTVDINDYGITYSGVTKAQVKIVAKKIGHMKSKKSKRFKTAYYTGNKITIGVNYKVVVKYNSPTLPYSYITNKGNKRVTYKGVRIGDSKKTVQRKLGPGYKLKKNVYRYGGAGGYLKCTFKNGKIKSWVFNCSPTG